MYIQVSLDTLVSAKYIRIGLDLQRTASVSGLQRTALGSQRQRQHFSKQQLQCQHQRLGLQHQCTANTTAEHVNFELQFRSRVELGLVHHTTTRCYHHKPILKPKTVLQTIKVASAPNRSEKPSG